MNRHGAGVSDTATYRTPRPTGRLMAIIAVVCVLAAIALPSTALAAENSWRYRDGRPIHLTEGGDDVASALAIQYSRWERWNDRWQTMYWGQWTTVEGPLAFGVDVSQWNGANDWATAKRSGVDFAILRCAYGRNVAEQDDYTFRENVQGCKANAIPFGVYLYSYARSVEDALDEADHALRVLAEAGVAPGDLAYPVYYDLEENRLASTANRGLLASMAQAFCSRIEAAGYAAGVYASQSWWDNFLTDPVFDRWERWVANWNARGTGSYLAYDRPYALWQFMDRGWVDGLGGVDIDFDYRSRPTNNPVIPDTDGGPGFVYRMYNRVSREHLMTADRAEALDLWERGWRYEGRAWTEPTGDATPVYRLYNPHTGEHLYTADEVECESLASIGWTAEGEKLRGADDADASARPVYRLHNPYEDGPAAHLYTMDGGERARLLATGWEDEAVAWYGLP